MIEYQEKHPNWYSSETVEPITLRVVSAPTLEAFQRKTTILKMSFDLFSCIEQEVGLDGLIGFQLHYSMSLWVVVFWLLFFG